MRRQMLRHLLCWKVLFFKRRYVHQRQVLPEATKLWLDLLLIGTILQPWTVHVRLSGRHGFVAGSGWHVDLLPALPVQESV
ncbi:MAG: hypothetical protein ACLPXB_11965 [Thiobacillaceae bacterium]